MSTKKTQETKSGRKKSAAEIEMPKAETLEKEVREEKLVEKTKAGSKVRKGAMPACLRVLISFLWLVVMAGVFTWFIFWQQNMGNMTKTWKFIEEKPVLTEYSYVIVLLLMCVVATVLWRPFLATGISFSIVSVLMYINTQKYLYRNAPLLPEDFLLADQAGTVMQFVDPWSVTRLVLGIILVLVGSGILEHGIRKIFGRNTKDKAWWERHSIVPRVSLTLVVLAVLTIFARPVLHYEDQTAEEDRDWITDLRFDRWNQKEDLERNGFVLAFLYNLGRFQEVAPDNYNEGEVQRIKEKYTQLANEAKTEYARLSQVADNVIVVLNESFIDPEILGEAYAHTGGDIVPNLHAIFEKYPSGYMYSTGYGGGTASVEFEVLTALSNYWAQTTPYVTALAKMRKVPGIIDEAAEDDFRTTAIHPFDGSMYKRNVVYKRMGVETFLDLDAMTNTKRENGGAYVSDQATYNEILDVLKDGEDQHMVMVATMQNHTPYDAARYDEFNFSLLGQFNAPYGIETYFETVHHSDEYLGEFVAELDKLKERTVMLWFGDHAPSILGEMMESGDSELVDLAHLTPYFIYANFDLDELYTEREVAKMNDAAGFELLADDVTLPIVTPNCLMSELYEVLGVKRPPIVYLSGEVCKENPILMPTYSKNDTVKQSESLQDYRMVNYDILSGKRYWLDD